MFSKGFPPLNLWEKKKDFTAAPGGKKIKPQIKRTYFILNKTNQYFFPPPLPRALNETFFFFFFAILSP